MLIEEIENRFKQVTNLEEMDLTKYPIKKDDYKKQSPTTDKAKSKEHGEVFTPIFLVDEMVGECKDLLPDKTYLDLCAGKGQFSIRILRALYNKFEDFNVDKFLKENNYFIQIQAESCADLIYVFGPDINIYVGSVFNLKYSEETDRGILFYDETDNKWKNNELVNGLIQNEKVRKDKKLLTFILNNQANEWVLKGIAI